MTWLYAAGDAVIGTVRHAIPSSLEWTPLVAVGDLRSSWDWVKTVDGFNAVIHLAGRAHVMSDRAHSPMAEFRAVNVQPTIELFKACQRASVRRFVFVSSIGVNGTATQGKAFLESDEPQPVEPYAVSKWEAEQALQALVGQGCTELVVVRPTLVCGPHAKGNFLRLMNLVDIGWPLPFGSCTTARSFVGLTNLCDLLWRCVHNPLAAQQVFLAADSPPIATNELMSTLAEDMNRHTRLVRVPPKLLTIIQPS